MNHKYLIIAVSFISFLFGGIIFADVQPRSVLAVRDCHNTCFESKDISGLLTSVGIQNVSGLIPNKVFETDKTIVIEHPFPEAAIHYVVIPKRDIRAAGEISVGDEEYLIDAYAVMDELIRRDGLTNYRIITNGPGFQNVTYLHFHLRAER